MSGFKDSIKGGWNPKGWTGKGDDPREAAKDHVSLPLSSLKDPASFGPPPKNVNYHRGNALRNKGKPYKSKLVSPPRYDRKQAKIAAEEAVSVEEDEEEERPPPLPSRRDIVPEGNVGIGRSSTPVTGPKPGLPPRLPPRQGSSPRPDAANSLQYSPAKEEPPEYRGILNQDSINRLGASGISVPGFGIGNKETPSSSKLTPSLSKFSGTSSTSANSSKPSSSQLNELQSRFSNMGTSPGARAPSQGTSWAQKQAALQTAASFRKDPSSVSLADAKSAVSTANNFRERHGDQLKAGLNTANKLNQKYGIAEKLQEHSNSNADESTRPELTPSPQSATRSPSPFVKKPPPPLPKKKSSTLQGITDIAAEPPPLPIASKPKPKDANRTTSLIGRQNSEYNTERKDLDFDLTSLWFAKSPPAFPPPSINRLPGTRGTVFDYGWSSPDGIRRIHFLNGAIRHNNTLETTKIRLTWDESNPGLTVKQEQKHLPPPRVLKPRELEEFQSLYAERIASWCESKIGQQVGNGECWTLAADALSSVASESRARNDEPCMTSQGLVHGYQIYCYISQKPSDPPGGIKAAGVARGDIAQFLSTHFQRKDGRGSSFAGAPDHTAVVVAVEADGALKVLEQNTGGVKRVRSGKYDPEELVAGELRVFRAVGESWIGALDSKWS